MNKRMNKIGKYQWEFRENTKVQEQKFYVLFLKKIDNIFKFV